MHEDGDIQGRRLPPFEINRQDIVPEKIAEFMNEERIKGAELGDEEKRGIVSYRDLTERWKRMTNRIITNEKIQLVFVWRPFVGA